MSSLGRSLLQSFLTCWRRTPPPLPAPPPPSLRKKLSLSVLPRSWGVTLSSRVGERMVYKSNWNI